MSVPFFFFIIDRFVKIDTSMGCFNDLDILLNLLHCQQNVQSWTTSIGGGRVKQPWLALALPVFTETDYKKMSINGLKIVKSNSFSGRKVYYFEQKLPPTQKNAWAIWCWQWLMSSNLC